MQEPEDDIIDIDFKAFFQILWKEKIVFLSTVLLIVSIGLWYAFTTQEQFVSEGKILPELQSKGGKLGGVVGLANLAGVDLASVEGTDAIRPDLYPDILKSTPFFLELFKQKIINKANQQFLFEIFYHQVIEKNKQINKEAVQEFPVQEKGFLVLNRLSEDRMENLKERIQVSIDKKSGIITISVKMPDPVVAATITRFSMEYLTEYVTRYRTEKTKKDVDFLAQKVADARGKFYNNQAKKAQYGDQFQLPTIRLQSADIQRERIESDYQMSSTFYNELLKKYEESKIRLQQDTPIFQVLEPPTAVTKRSEPKRVIILLISLILGGIVATIIVLLRKRKYKLILRNR